MSAAYIYDSTYFNHNGWRHDGIDLAAPTGTVTRSAVDGKVVFIDPDTWGVVTVEDSQGKYHIYKHLDTISVSPGTTVKSGDVVGTVGGRGDKGRYQFGAHLHYDVLNAEYANGGSSVYGSVNIEGTGLYKSEADLKRITQSPLQAFWDWKNQDNTGHTCTDNPETLGDFNDGLQQILKWEGGFVNHPSDPGGATNQGIIQKTYNSYRDRVGLPIQSVEYISQNEVNTIYYEDFWLGTGSDKLTSKLAIVHFDASVNHGPGNSSWMLPQAEQGGGNDSTIASRYLNIREQFYYDIVASNPSQNVFLKGWLNRINDLRTTLAV